MENEQKRSKFIEIANRRVGDILHKVNNLKPLAILLVILILKKM